MLEIISAIIRLIRPFLVPICFVAAWSVFGMAIWSMWSAARDSITTAQKMHQIPCANCQFFTDDYRLKCTVHPHIANTEAAIDCGDFQVKPNSYWY